jgi:hypothetical protein
MVGAELVFDVPDRIVEANRVMRIPENVVV